MNSLPSQILGRCTPFMRVLIVLILFFLLWGCKNSTQQVSQAYHVDSSHIQEMEVEKAFPRFQKLLDSLYTISEKDSKQALLLANEFIIRYKDTIKKQGFNMSEIEDLHNLKGEIFYHLGMYKKSLDEFDQSGNDLGRASNYMKLKMHDSAYAILSEESSGYYLYDFEWANFYEMVGKPDSAIKLYKKMLKQKWIHNGNYERLKDKTSKRLNALLKNEEALTDLYFPTNNPKYKNEY